MKHKLTTALVVAGGIGVSTVVLLPDDLGPHAGPLPHIDCPRGMALYSPDTQIHRCVDVFRSSFE